VSRRRSLGPVASVEKIDEVVWPPWGPPGVPHVSSAEMDLAVEGRLNQKSAGDIRGEMQAGLNF
jgi:hypothetical protein